MKVIHQVDVTREDLGLETLAVEQLFEILVGQRFKELFRSHLT